MNKVIDLKNLIQLIKELMNTICYPKIIFLL